MDLKYEHENILLKNEFISGLKNILDINSNNKSEIISNIIFNSVKELIKKEKNLNSICNEYNNLSSNNRKYYVFLKNTLIRTKAEYNQINQIKKIVMYNNNSNFINSNNYYKEVAINKMNSEPKINIHSSLIVNEEVQF